MKLLLLLIASAFTSHAASFYLTVAGLGGDPDYEKQFAAWATDLDHQLKMNGPDAHVETLYGATATKQHLHDVFQNLAGQVGAEDTFSLILLGHGTFDDSEYKFNIPGPDVTAAELRELLSHIKATRQMVAVLTSCSGAAMEALATKNRVVMTATKSGTEKNATVFPRYFIEAFHDNAADTDKNGVISALEVFRYAQQKVTAYFTSEKLIASEHALFSDTGLVAGVRDPSPQNQQGLVAAGFALLKSGGEVALASNPVKQKLISHKDELEAKIDRLKYEKASLPEADYKQQLTALLLDLARTQAEIDK